MIVRRVLSTDLPTISRWWGARDLPPVFSPTGFIVEGIGAGFLCKTDTYMALFEGLVVNPEAPPVERQEALRLIQQAICQEAKDSGFTHVLGITAFDAVVRHAENNGFTRASPTYQVVYKRV